MKRKVLAFITVSALMAAVFTGCGSTAASSGSAKTGSATASSSASGSAAAANSASGSSSAESTGKVDTVTVVTANSYAPFCYVDANNQFQGFDVEVLKAIDDLAPDISIKFETCDWSAMLPGLDAGRYDLCAYQLGKTDERQQMYYFGQMPYCYDAGGAIITTPDHTNWKSFDDIAAAHGTVACIVGSNFTNYVEDYLKKHPNAFQTKYYDSELPAVLEDIANGRVDCTINDGAVALSKAKDNNLTNIKLGGYVTPGTPIWFVYGNNDRGHELATKMDKYTKELAQSGKLAQIAQETLGSTKAADLLVQSDYMKNK